MITYFYKDQEINAYSKKSNTFFDKEILHNLLGPSIIYENGFPSYYIDGNPIVCSNNEFPKQFKEKITQLIFNDIILQFKNFFPS